MNNISITIPMDYDALTRAGNMLHDLASDIEKIPAAVVAATTAPAPAPAPAATTAPAPAATTAPAPAATTAPAPAATTAPDMGVELDTEGLPWDARIHGDKKLKLAKTETWKLKRGVDPALVEQVKAELRAAMAAPALAPAPAPAAEVVAPAPAAEVVAPAPAAVGTTFPELLAKITTTGIGPDAVTAAVTSAGLPSIQLLAARPDLIPTVEAALFPAA